MASATAVDDAEARSDGFLGADGVPLPLPLFPGDDVVQVASGNVQRRADVAASPFSHRFVAHTASAVTQSGPERAASSF